MLYSEKAPEEYQEASNNYDMLKGCVNRMFVSDDLTELPKLHAGALHYLEKIYTYGKKRLEDRNANPEG